MPPRRRSGLTRLDVYVILGTIKVKTEHLATFLVHVRAHAEASAREPGCVRYDVLQDVDDPQTICLYEVFRSEEALHVHHQQDYYKAWMAMSDDWRERSTYSRRVLRNIYPDDRDWSIRS